MNISVIYAPGPYAQEINLIEQLCKYEGHKLSIINPEHSDFKHFKKYYKGGHPAIIIDIMVEDKPVVLYGFWQFAEWLIKNGMLRC